MAGGKQYYLPVFKVWNFKKEKVEYKGE